MSALEQEIIERISRLGDDKKQQVLAFVRDLEKPPFSFEEWFQRVRQLRADEQAVYGKDHRVDVQALLDEVREEPLDDRLGGR